MRCQSLGVQDGRDIIKALFTFFKQMSFKLDQGYVQIQNKNTYIYIDFSDCE